jgi:hypothetical protein
VLLLLLSHCFLVFLFLITKHPCQMLVKTEIFNGVRFSNKVVPYYDSMNDSITLL